MQITAASIVNTISGFLHSGYISASEPYWPLFTDSQEFEATQALSDAGGFDPSLAGVALIAFVFIWILTPTITANFRSGRPPDK